MPDVSVKNYLFPPKLISKPSHFPPRTGNITFELEILSLFIGGPGNDIWVFALIPGKEPVGKKDSSE